MESINGAVFILGYILILGGVPVYVARKKGRGVLVPFLLGVALGPIGWFLAFAAKPKPSQEELENRRKEYERKEMEAKNSGKEWLEW